MTDTDPVSVSVEIINDFSDDIQELKSELKSIERDIGVNLDIDDNGDIDWAKLELENIEDVIEVLMEIDDRGLDEALAKKNLLKKDTKSTHTVEQKTRSSIAGGLQDAAKSHMGFEGISGTHNIKASIPDDSGDALPDSSLVSNLNKLIESDGKNAFGGSTLKRLLPTVRTWMTLIAAILPMMIALAAAVGGLVTALAAVGVAGVTAFAFGAWGLDDLQGRINTLKDELDSLFEPVQSAFAPFVRDMLGTLPRRLETLVEPLQDLTIFEGTISRGIDGVIQWVSDLIDEITEVKSEIDSILSTLGNAFGQSIIEFLRWLVEETEANKEQFLQLASVIRNMMAVIYELSKVVSFVIANFSFLFGWLRTVTEFLDNNFIIAILTGITVIGLFAMAVKSLTVALAVLSGGIIAKAIAGLAYYIGEALIAIGVTEAWTAATIKLASALALATAGLSVLLGGVAALASYDSLSGSDPTGGSPSGMSGSGVGAGSYGSEQGNTYITVEGDIDRDSLNRLNDKLDSSWQTYSSREEDREM